MKCQVTFLQTDPGYATELIRRITDTVSQHAQKAARALSYTCPVNITIYPNPAWAIPETGVGGYTPTADWIQISIDLTGTTHPLEEVIEKWLPGTIYHEMNHIVRWRTTGYGTTPLEAMVSEGLATIFEHEMWPDALAPWTTFGTGEEERYLTLLAEKKELLDKSYHHDAWFFGSTDELPRWFGYKVGTFIVRKAIENTQNNIVRYTSVPAREIAQASKLLS